MEVDGRCDCVPILLHSTPLSAYLPLSRCKKAPLSWFVCWSLDFVVVLVRGEEFSFVWCLDTRLDDYQAIDSVTCRVVVFVD